MFCFCPLPSNCQNFSSSPRAPVTKQKMVCHQVIPLWARRVQASPCTPPSPRAREESPSSTVLTRTTTCRPRPSRGTPPSPAKGEIREERMNERGGGVCVYPCFRRNITIISAFSLISSLCVSTSLRHTGEDFIVTPFAQVSFT